MKKLFALSTIALFLCLGLSAQISNDWTSTIKSRNLPPGATVPSVASLSSPHKLKFAISLDGTTIDNATETAAWTALGAATKTAIDSNWVEEIYGLDPSLDIVARTVITRVTRRFDNFTPGDLAQQYTAATNIFYVEGVFEYEIESP